MTTKTTIANIEQTLAAMSREFDLDLELHNGIGTAWSVTRATKGSSNRHTILTARTKSDLLYEIETYRQGVRMGIQIAMTGRI